LIAIFYKNEELIMEVMDVFGGEKWKSLLASLSEKLNMAALLLDAEGRLLLSCGNRNLLCKSIRENEQSLKFICGQTAAAMTAQLKATLQPAKELCEAGLIRIAVPVIRDGMLLGQVTACGLATDINEVDPFMISKQLGISEEEANTLIQSIGPANEEEIQTAATELFKEFNL
jgi:ligand-binding sensor protein